MDKTYTPKNIEQPLYEQWRAAGLFKPTFDPNKENFSIIIPPPNVTGTLHMGHAFQHTLMDIMTRYNRMLGKNTLWQPGTDHAGIATQMVVERKIAAEEGKTRHDYGRDAFIEKVWEWKHQSGGSIEGQIARLGNSTDWERNAFTLDEQRSEVVRKVFVELFRQGLIYRGKKLVNWDPKLRTAISDLEVENRDVNSNLWSFRYPLEEGITTKDGKDYIVISTTRPETMFGDTAVAVNPEDERYLDLVGKKVYIPVVNRWIPIIADEYVEKDFGTGMVKITPAHDFNDYEVGKRNKLDMINIMDPEANLLVEAPIFNTNGKETGEVYVLPEAYQGLERFAARKKIIAEFEKKGYLDKIEPHKMVIPYGDRGGVVIEPYLTDQWYMDVQDMAKTAKEVVDDGRIKFVPEQYVNMYNTWMNNIQDWCISRQLWWGHRIPAWYDAEGNYYVGYSEAEVREHYGLAADLALVQDEDVLDTWFSSALWTFSTLGWPEKTKEMEFFHPSTVLVTGFDIIFFWVARMIMLTTHFVKNEDGTPQIPFKYVYYTPLIQDEEGNKMSKSKGNVLDPLDMIDGISLEDLIEKRTGNMMQPQLAEKIAKRTAKQFPNGIQAYGTDALRFTCAALASSGRAINWDMSRLEGYRNFCNKLWNASRFVMMGLEQNNTKFNLDLETYQRMASKFSDAERWIESEFSKTLEKVEFALQTFRFDQLANVIYDFIWNKFCNWYLELAKVNLSSDNSELVEVTQYQLLRILEASLRMAHVIIPFITEEIWQNLKQFSPSLEGYLMVQNYPQASEYKQVDTSAIEKAQEFITIIREMRAENNVPPAKKIECNLVYQPGADISYLENNRQAIIKLANLSELKVTSEESQELTISQLFGTDQKIELLMAELVNLDAELAKLEKQVATLHSEIARVDGKLANEAFVNKAPAKLIEEEKAKRVRHLESLEQVKLQIEKLHELKAKQ